MPSVHAEYGTDHVFWEVAFYDAFAAHSRGVAQAGPRRPVAFFGVR